MTASSSHWWWQTHFRVVVNDFVLPLRAESMPYRIMSLAEAYVQQQHTFFSSLPIYLSRLCGRKAILGAFAPWYSFPRRRAWPGRSAYKEGQERLLFSSFMHHCIQSSFDRERRRCMSRTAPFHFLCRMQGAGDLPQSFSAMCPEQQTHSIHES